MKYALLFLALFFSVAIKSQARTIHSFHDSQALMTIAQFMIDNAEDMRNSIRISDKKLTIKDASTCTVVSSKEVIKTVDAAILAILRLYPDEELPVDEALSDLADYLGTGPLTKCNILQKNERMKINAIYFFDKTNDIHVKVDTVTLAFQ